MKFREYKQYFLGDFNFLPDTIKCFYVSLHNESSKQPLYNCKTNNMDITIDGSRYKRSHEYILSEISDFLFQAQLYQKFHKIDFIKVEVHEYIEDNHRNFKASLKFNHDIEPIHFEVVDGHVYWILNGTCLTLRDFAPQYFEKPFASLKIQQNDQED